ncbi:hypothetical protein B0H13DRAFT_2021502 [Mycena leptocephala]|nr:hypothetical protein B0H13DRAFT_2021502 [Mycena leptocephala]
MAASPEHRVEVREAATTLARIVSAGLDNELNRLDPLYSDIDVCMVLINRRPDLYALLNFAHGNKDYSDVERHTSIRRTKAKDEITTWLDKLRPLLATFIHNEHPFDCWKPDPELESDPSTVAHIESLKIPEISTRPSLLIHDLGAFAENATLQNRIDNIFQKNKKTFLVNTSGSGKTRLSLEGLCQHWGFYFTMALDANDLGSGDSNAMAVARNVEIAEKRLGQLLLSRLLLFHMYSEIIRSHGFAEDHKRKWLLFQLRPHLMGDPSYDIFAELKSYTYPLTPDEVQDLIAIMFLKLRMLHGPEFHLFYVVDEAQLVSRKYTGAFRHEGKPYPLLRQMIQSWAAKSHPEESSFILVGTDIPKDGFENAPFAASIRWCSDTGALMTRYRLTDGLIKALLRDGFRTPHKLLGSYIVTTTTHRPTDYKDDEPFRFLIDVDVGEYSPDWFTRSTLLKSTIQQVLFHYLATARPPAPFSEDLTSLVAAAFGRFTDKNLSRVVMDEPLFLVRAARWFCEAQPVGTDDSPRRPAPLDNCFEILTDKRTSTSSRSFATFLAYYLAHAFQNGSMLRKVFSFPHKPAPEWAKQTVVLAVSTGKQGSFASFDDSSASNALVCSASTLGGLESWLDGAEGARTPFCLTHTTDPDLLFVLKLEDGRFVRVILHSVVTDTNLQKLALKRVMGRLEPSNLFREAGENADSSDQSRVAAKYLDTSQPDGPFAVLRVIASFPAKTFLGTLSSPTKTSPIANLNSNLFRRITTDIPATEILDQLITAATTGKRKRHLELPRPPDVQRKKPRVQPEAPRSPEPSRILRPRKGKPRAS